MVAIIEKLSGNDRKFEKIYYLNAAESLEEFKRNL